MKTYFVTGATGAIGAALVPLLLVDDDTRVILLMRAKDQAHLESRMADLMKFWEYPPDDLNICRRIKTLKGDVTLPEFGLSPEEYQKIADECTHIIHSAGNVRMNLPIEAARAASVGSAKNIIQLAVLCQGNGNLKKIEFVSTVGVGGKTTVIVPEEWLTSCREFHNTYEQAKAEAEDYIREKIEEGLPITVHRPSMVVGDSKTGKIIHFQIFYHLCEFLSGTRTLGILPGTGNIRLDIIPLDYVAGAIVWSSRTETTIGKILHECSGPHRAILISELKKTVWRVYKNQGKKLPHPFSSPIWVFKLLLPVIGLFVSGASKRAMKALPVFIDYMATNQIFSNDDSMQLLPPSLDAPLPEEYLESVIGTYVKNCQS